MPQINKKLKKILSIVGQIILGGAIILGVMTWKDRSLVKSGDIAPDFMLTTVSGEKVFLSQYRGKKVVIYFFAPWCSICKMSSSSYSSMRKYFSDDTVLLSVVLSWSSLNEITNYPRANKLTVPILVGTEEVMKKYNISAFPTFYFIDKKGKVQYRVSGYTTPPGLWVRTWLL
jgi:peroxiredoxin